MALARKCDSVYGKVIKVFVAFGGIIFCRVQGIIEWERGDGYV